MSEKGHQSLLFVGAYLSASKGTRAVAEDLAVRLRDRHWSVKITSTSRSRAGRLIDVFWTIWSSRSDYQIGCVDVFSGNAFWWAYGSAKLLRTLGKPIILTLHGGKLPIFAARWPRHVRWLLSAADRVVTPSEYLRAHFFEIRDDIVLLRNAIDLSDYRFEHRVSAEPRLAWLRAFHSIYNPSLAVRAVALLAKDYPRLMLTMYGPDKHDGSLAEAEQLARELEIAERLVTPGSIPKSGVPQCLSRYDIFLNTTTAESFGVSVVEAAALGMCIVSTNVGELPYIWTHDHDALLVPPNDPHAMADAVRRILTEPGLAERLSRNARKTAEQFDWSFILQQWEAILMSVIEKDSSG